MINFYLLPLEICIAISIAAAICVIAQSITLILNLNRYHIDRAQILANLSEIFILSHTLLLSYMIAHLQNSMKEDLITAPENAPLRYIIFVSILIGELIISRKKKNAYPLLTIFVAFMTLPLIENITGSIFILIFSGSLLFWLVRSIAITRSVYKKIKTEISELSIKEAIDVLHTGILFCERDGHIILTNKRMQELMILLTGKIQRNGRQFYSQIQSGGKQALFEISELEGSIVYMLSDRSVWMFREDEIKIDNKKYYQISASDVTLQWSTTMNLKQQNEQLELRSMELKNTIANLKSIYMNEESHRIKNHIHNILGQRIAALTRTLRKKEIPDKALLTKFTTNLSDDLLQTKTQYSAEQEMKIMVEMFKGIGVDVAFYGELPQRQELAKFFVTIITESITNAVRHGFATEIEIMCIDNDVEWNLEISNLGILPENPIREGGGISSIRRRLHAMGGTLDLKISSRFLLLATIPKGA